MRHHAVRKVIAAAALAAFAFRLSACNTVSGIGKDIQETSENTSEAIGNAIND